ncbi:MAG: helical backbone metal receptor [Bacteroidota bacterium]
MKYYQLAVLWVVLTLVSVSCGSQSDQKQLVENAPYISIKLEDDTGRKLSLPSAPERIVSIAPNITESIFAIGAGDMMVARSQACDYPYEVESIPPVTTYPELDLEQIRATEADLIVTTDEIFTQEDLDLLKVLDIPVYLQSYEKLQDVYKGIRTLGKVLGKQEQANTLADSLEELEGQIIDSTQNEIKYSTLILISSDPLMVVGGTGFLNELIEKAGGKNAFGSIKESYPTVTQEAILKAAPEYLIIPGKRSQAYAELINLYPALTNTPADIQKQVYLVNPDLYFRPGPRMLDALLELTNILHSKYTRSSFISP